MSIQSKKNFYYYCIVWRGVKLGSFLMMNQTMHTISRISDAKTSLTCLFWHCDLTPFFILQVNIAVVIRLCLSFTSHPAQSLQYRGSVSEERKVHPCWTVSGD